MKPWVTSAISLLLPVAAHADCAPLLSGFSTTHRSYIYFITPGGNQNAADLNAALNAWNMTCEVTTIPHMERRNSPSAGALNITVSFQTHGVPCGQASHACACTSPDLNNGVVVGGSIKIYEFDANGDACDTSNQTRRVMHEVGHILGFADALSSQCNGHLMYGYSGGGGTVTQELCNKIDDRWLTSWEMESPDPEPTTDPCGGGAQCGSPIIIDLDRNRFDLVGLDDPVPFDIDGDGETELLSWTASESLDAFLWLDRNGNGVVDDGRELFGNHTPLIDGSTADNGYIPLAEFDLVAMGGNGNGFIDPEDVAYGELLLWIDWDHNGASDPGEVLPLGTAGVTRLDLAYHVTNRRDEHGNWFRYFSRAWIVIDGHQRRTWSTDVFFVLR